MNREKNGYHKLLVHQKADELAFEVYKITKDFPKEEVFGITSQARRAALSVPANIAEGYARRGVKEKLHFFNISQGSLVELEYFIEFSKKLNYISDNDFNKLISQKEEVGRLLHGFIKSLKPDD